MEHVGKAAVENCSSSQWLYQTHPKGNILCCCAKNDVVSVTALQRLRNRKSSTRGSLLLEIKVNWLDFQNKSLHGNFTFNGQ